jgi:hypothetical protein
MSPELNESGSALKSCLTWLIFAGANELLWLLERTGLMDILKLLFAPLLSFVLSHNFMDGNVKPASPSLLTILNTI